MLQMLLLLPAGAAALHVLATPPAACDIGGTGRAKAMWRCLREGIDPFDEAEAAGALSPKARAVALAAGFTPPRASHTLLDSTVSSCGTRKMLLGMEDGAAVEAVLIPMEGGRRNEVRYTTLCVSSQVGCKRGCVFCATGAMGIKRSLSTAEISAQLFESLRAAREHNMPPLTNVVFMGMGEPLDNAKAVSEMLALMVDPFAYALAKNRISVSTVGPSPEAIRGMRSFPARLAWSVHAADDATRRLLVPTTRHPIAELRDAFADVLETRADRGLMVECTLLDGINDSLEHADNLAELLRPLPGRTRVNLIPYNPNVGLGASAANLRTSRAESVRAFQRRIIARGYVCTVRETRGQDGNAACGQLSTRFMSQRAAAQPA